MSKAATPRSIVMRWAAVSLIMLSVVSCGGSSGGGAASASANAGGAATSIAFSGNVLLGAPTSTGIRANVFSTDLNGTVSIAYGTTSGALDRQTGEQPLMAGQPTELLMAGLAPDVRYYYRVRHQDAAGLKLSPEYTFRTARAAGSTFTFTLQADSHLDENASLDVYRQTLANIRSDAPDFHIDLGDTFMCEKHTAPLTALVQSANDQATVNARYAYERANFGLIAHSSPLFLVNGNHDAELGWLLDGSAQNLAIWATRARQTYYANPTPDAFYSGDMSYEPYVGRRGSWYAWTWGDAQFIVLDPFWSTTVRSNTDGWVFTLGARQYQWLADTLSASRSTFKFVFIHNLVGGLGGQMRGGAEAAPYYEWGGRNADGSAGFAQKRPGWALPIHSLLVQHRVTAVFHGHDHLYARQELDGIIYQEVPQPSTRNTGNASTLATEGQYASGTILGSSGHLRITVTPTAVTTQYVRAWLAQDENASRHNAQIDDAWSVAAPAGH